MATPRTACVLAGTEATSGSLIIGPAVLFPPWWAVAGLLASMVVDLSAVARRTGTTGPRSGAQAARGIQSGEVLWLIELYAAHPTGQGHGGRLVDELVRNVPSDVWLMTAAASASLAEHYRTRYGFRSWDPDRPWLLERPPAGLPPLGPRTLTPELGHAESSICWRKRDDRSHGPQALHR